MTTNAASFTGLSDADLIVEVSRLAERERAATADLVEALMEFDVRRLYLGEGYPSLFVYCTRRLLLSESAAYVRIEAARAARAWPLVLDHLRAGSLTLTAIKVLAPHLTEANHRAVIAAAAGCTTERVKELVARITPRPDVPSSIRKLPACRAEAPHSGRGREPGGAAPERPPREGTASSLLAPTTRADDHPSAASPAASRPQPMEPRRAVVLPLSPARYQLQVTVSANTREKLRQLQDLLRGEIPSGDPAVIVDRALSLLLEHVERRKFAATRRPRTRRAANPRPSPVSSRSTDPEPPTANERSTPAARTSPTSARRRARRIPAAVKRAVWRRDAGQCTEVSPNGERCESRSFLEFHHRVPVADGGLATVDNLALKCAAHHRVESERIFAWRRVPDPSLGGVGSHAQQARDRVAPDVVGDSF